MPYVEPSPSGAAAVALRVAEELGLSRRETEVLLAVAAGKCIKETAADLGVSEKAVQYFWARIFVKSGCASQVQVLALLLRHATTSPAR
jgi:DNA-binding CsgD family transcriptional regulator